MVSEYFISTAKLPKFVDSLLLGTTRLLAPLTSFGRSFLDVVTAQNFNRLKLSGYRTVESIKGYFFNTAQTVSSYFGQSDNAPSRDLIILGARGCDTEALDILDKVFLEGEFPDPFYRANREQVTIISADCTEAGPTCFCSLVKGQPYAVRAFDLNLSPVDQGYYVEVASAKGQKLVDSKRSFFESADPAAKQARESNRRRVGEILVEQNRQYLLKLDLTESHQRNLENKAWRRWAKDCVECSACNFACPTCSCFLLIDSGSQNRYSRHKIWDACLKAGYARVAGGANDRGQLHQRLQNRYQCKFNYSVERLGRYACVGCGRCLDGCAGKIEMRQVLVELEKQVPLTAKLA